MKFKKLLTLLPLFVVSLSACDISGVHHESSEYFLDLEYHDNFKIMQLTDIHVGIKDDLQKHFDFMDLSITEGNPDMLILTGDLFTFADKVTAIKLFDWVDSHNIPWTVTWGNHDEQCYFSVDWVTGVLNNWGGHCLFKDIQDDDVKGNANFVINLKKGGVVEKQIYIIDSNRYNFTKFSGYDYIYPSQIEWYERMVNYSKSTYGGGNVIPSLLYYHIPVPEFSDAYEAYKNEEAIGQGEEREAVCSSKINSGFFSKIKELGSSKAMFVGHDHLNDFDVKYQGVWFSYGVNSTDRVYYDENVMGAKMLTLPNSLDDISLNSFTKYFHHYNELGGN